MQYIELQNLLDSHYYAKNDVNEISLEKPDPLFVARAYKDSKYISEIALICALFSYGNARAIVRFLQTLDFSFLQKHSSVLGLNVRAYRFQNTNDVALICEIMRLCVMQGGIKSHFIKAYNATPTSNWRLSKNIYHSKILYGIYACIDLLREIAYSLLPKCVRLSQGVEFYLGKPHTLESLPSNAAPLKRWNMYLRWLVRKDNIDLGLWSKDVNQSHLILPLDTHTFHICQKLGLISLKSYNLRAALEASDNLSVFCPNDPVKYDFALYRIGQYKVLES